MFATMQSFDKAGQNAFSPLATQEESIQQRRFGHLGINSDQKLLKTATMKKERNSVEE